MAHFTRPLNSSCLRNGRVSLSRTGPGFFSLRKRAFLGPSTIPGARRVLDVDARAAQTAAQTQPVNKQETVLTSTQVPVKTYSQPGVDDDNRFEQDWSVQFWRDFRIPQEIKDQNLTVLERVQAIFRTLQQKARYARVTESAQSVAYWTYHLSRMGFFSIQGLAGLAFSNLMVQRERAARPTPGGNRQDFFDMANLLRSGIYVPLGEALAMFYQDYENIRAGIYKMPWDFTTPGHQQSNPLNILDKTIRFMREASSTLQRRSIGKPDNVWLESGLYPEYYLNTWHYQTDGWLSEESAKVYETSTETVFVGRQDAMQRQSLVPLHDFMLSKGSANGDGLQLIEVGSGTGRFATFVKDNHPKLGVTQLELSPFYLQEARKNLDYWRSRRGGPSPEDSAAHKDRFLHAAAEDIPVEDESYDVAVSVYLFHELPEEARQKSVSEMFRVLKPGGMAILTDGTQLGDRPVNDPRQGNFEAFNEPNWGTHIATDYGKLFEDFGFTAHKKVLASGTKVLSFYKPLSTTQSSNNARSIASSSNQNQQPGSGM